MEARGGRVVSGTALQGGRSRFDTRWGRGDYGSGVEAALTEMSTRVICWGQRRLVGRADNVATFVCRLSRNCGSLNLLGPKGPLQLLMHVSGFVAIRYTGSLLRCFAELQTLLIHVCFNGLCELVCGPASKFSRSILLQ
jgi:hypothetical protein